ncbi:hypothetical protein APHAL10511_004196 [Amanita phalloides]|nr:hypothetical protein APHAL10511_004196 [Amanita phalloides]
MSVFVTVCSDTRMRELDQVRDALIGTIQYARTRDYDPDAPRRGSLNRAIHAIAIVGKASDGIYLVAPLSNNWPDTTHKASAGEFVDGTTGEIHVGAPYKIHKHKIRLAHDGGHKSLKPGALERLRAKMQNAASFPPLYEGQQGEKSHDGYQSDRVLTYLQYSHRSVRGLNTYGTIGRARL